MWNSQTNWATWTNNLRRFGSLKVINIWLHCGTALEQSHSTKGCVDYMTYKIYLEASNRITYHSLITALKKKKQESFQLIEFDEKKNRQISDVPTCDRAYTQNGRRSSRHLMKMQCMRGLNKDKRSPPRKSDYKTTKRFGYVRRFSFWFGSHRYALIYSLI